MSPTSRLAPALLTLALMVAAAVLALSARAADIPAAAPTRAALTVTVTQPQPADLSITITANGSIAAWQDASVGSEVAGLRLETVRVNVGDVVRRGQLLVEHPLAPRVEIDEARQRHPGDGRAGPVRVGELVGPAGGLAVLITQRAPEREVIESFALPRPEVAVGRTASWREWDFVHEFKSFALGCPDRVALQEVGRGVGRVRRRREDRDAVAGGCCQIGELGDCFHPQVERAGKAAGDREIRRWCHRRHRRSRVQRVDQDEVGAEFARRPRAELREVTDVAETPRAT